jgi:phosphoglycerate dehydrogenase-like enzyme
MRIHALRRNPERSAGDTLLDKSYGPDALDVLLAESDYLLAAAPLTPETRGLIGRRALGLMKETAVLINLGRGPVVDEAALVEALKAKRIKGAVLDVFNQEPLPEGHAYYGWRTCYCRRIRPTIRRPGWTRRWTFIANFDRWMAGEPLPAVADKKAGY